MTAHDKRLREKIASSLQTFLKEANVRTGYDNCERFAGDLIEGLSEWLASPAADPLPPLPAPKEGETARPTFWCDTDGEPLGNLGPDLEHAVKCIADHIEAALSDAENGEEFFIKFGRVDLTQSQEDSLPEL